MRKTYLLIVALFAICTTNLSFAENILLQAPLEVSEEVINNVIAKDALKNEMTWSSCVHANLVYVFQLRLRPIVVPFFN